MRRERDQPRPTKEVRVFAAKLRLHDPSLAVLEPRWIVESTFRARCSAKSHSFKSAFEQALCASGLYLLVSASRAAAHLAGTFLTHCSSTHRRSVGSP